MYIIVYRPHNELNASTTYYGPFSSWSEADDALCSLPALGVFQPAHDLDNPGVKYIAELTSPNTIAEAA